MRDRHSASAPRCAPVIWLDGPCEESPGVSFSIATLVTDPAAHAEMRASFEAHGFADPDCEYLSIDNTGPEQTCAYKGLNAALAAARGTYVILCHQDVRLLADDRSTLEARLSELSVLDPNWALAGNAGGIAPGRLAIRITDPHGADQRTAELPARVVSLDENFFVVRRAARAGFSVDLSGFHFYGADICLNAAQAGYSAYVIDFHLAHLSGGTKSESFYEAEAAFRAKWSRALSPRWIQTTCALVRLSGDPIGNFAGRLAGQPFAAIVRRLSRTRGI